VEADIESVAVAPQSPRAPSGALALGSDVESRNPGVEISERRIVGLFPAIVAATAGRVFGRR
jgi:hypothetical protein